ncbi:Mobile element protein [Candidatus Desulforudis audaxviator]|nr:Mobile element protein [Candidatus Desulforudis audaxviator]
MTALQYQYGLSDRDVCNQVGDRISWRRFCRIPLHKRVPHPSTLSKIRRRLDADGSDHMAELNEHLIRKAAEEKIIKSRTKVRVDTTVVEANIHHPTDSGLIADTVRVVTRLAKKIQAVADDTGASTVHKRAETPQHIGSFIEFIAHSSLFCDVVLNRNG